MPLLLPVIASLRSNRSPSSYFKRVKECVPQRWCQPHLTHESSLGNRVKLNVSNVGVGCKGYTSLTWTSWWRSAESVCRVWTMQAGACVVYCRISGGGKWTAGWIFLIMSANVGRLNSTVLLEGPLPSCLFFPSWDLLEVESYCSAQLTAYFIPSACRLAIAEELHTWLGPITITGVVLAWELIVQMSKDVIQTSKSPSFF